MNTPTADQAPQTGWYRIQVLGHLSARWATRFDGMSLTPERDGSTLIQGPVVDQAALHGLLAQIRDTGLPLLSVTHTPAATTHPDPSPPASPTQNPTAHRGEMS